MFDYIFEAIGETESNLSATYKNLKDWGRTEYYIEQSTIHSKQIKDKKKRTAAVFRYLNHQSNLYYNIGNYIISKAIREKAYIYVSKVYDPEHPLVLQAGGKLIEILTETGDYYDAERYARFCYDGLTHAPLNPDSKEAAMAASNLVDASYNMIKESGPESADINEAEALARKGVRITKELMKHSKSAERSFCILIDILLYKENYGDETNVY